ncbi:Anion exchange protein [Aphelenchoides fujianensis]|nr:Anion exchange protein [Aphelenchoides fujianensis]
MSEANQCNVDSERIKKLLMLNHNHVTDRRMSRISSMFFDRFDQQAPQRPPGRSRSAAPFPQHSPAAPTNGIHLSASTNSHLNAHEEHGSSLPRNPMIHSAPLELSNQNDVSPSAPPMRNRSISAFVRNKLGWSSTSRPAQLEQYKNDFVLRNLPKENIESAQVFTGVFPQLQKIRFCMVRLERAVLMPELVDGPIPLGRAVCTLMSNPSFNALAYKAQNNEELIKAFDCFLDGSVVIPPGEGVSPCSPRAAEANGNAQNGGQKRYHLNGNGIRPVVSGGDPPGDEPPKRRFRFFNGLVEDVKNRLPLYGSDFRDACNFQCLTSVIFMFLASVAPAITFGGLLGSYTNEKIGTIETLFAQCICGVIWGLFAAQPLLIMSATGPVLVFETSLYVTCETLGLEFMTVRLYAGIFIFVISLLITAVDGSRLLVFVTRFTEAVENFLYYETAHAKCGEEAGLPVPNLTFTPLRNVDPLGRLANRSLAVAVAKREVGPNGTDLLGAAFNLTGSLPTAARPHDQQRDVHGAAAAREHALLDGRAEHRPSDRHHHVLNVRPRLLLKKLRESFYLGRTLRRALGDFGVLIAITIVAVIVQHYIPDPYLARLEMPDELNFTNPAQRGHGLVIVPTVSEMEWKGIVVALVAALLVFILLYVETEITELLLARKERGCRKGSGMNWDLVLLGFCSLCSIW